MQKGLSVDFHEQRLKWQQRLIPDNSAPVVL